MSKKLSKNPKLTEAKSVKQMLNKKNGAGDEIRTHDSLLGKQILYH